MTMLLRDARPLSSHDEYRRLSTTWPWELPHGYRMPGESRQPERTEMPTFWALSELYFYWRGATATAAQAAHLRGDTSRSRRLLDRIRQSYSESITRSIVDDPASEYIADAVLPASHGDFSVLALTDIAEFLNNTNNATDARLAGDL